MKRFICMLMALCIVFGLAACRKMPADDITQTTPEETSAEWTRQGYFTDAAEEYLVSVTWMETEEQTGWYVGYMIGEDMGGGYVQQEGKTLKGTVPTMDDSEVTITVTEDGEDGIAFAFEGGETYHLVPYDVPEATIFVSVNSEGPGNIAYTKGEEAPEIDTDYPYQSAQINLAEPEVHTFTAWSDIGGLFVKWTKNGEDFSDEATVTVNLDESADFVAVFDYDPDWVSPMAQYAGNYQCDRASAEVTDAGVDAGIIIKWANSASEDTVWYIWGRLDGETKTVTYEYATKAVQTYDGDGDVTDSVTEYEDGTGTVTFNDDGTFTWHEDNADHEDMTFERIEAVDPAE